MYVAAIDQGTTGTRCLLFDREASVVAEAYETHEQFYPRPGWVEHDPEELWRNTRRVVGEALGAADADARELAALGITNQRETTVVWDAETGEPLHNAIVWQDRRTAERIEGLDEEFVATVRERTGLEPDAYFSATKMEWLLDHCDLLGRAEAGQVLLGTIDAWLVYKLTGEHVTDVTNAARTMLFDIHDCEWDSYLCSQFGVSRAALPEVHPSSEDRYGTTNPDGFLGAEVPVTAALGDQQAALFGQTCFDPGQAKNTYGTGSFVLLNTGPEPVQSDHGLLTTVGFQREGEPVQYALEGSVFATGAAVEWLVDVGLAERPAESEELARAVDSTDGVYLVPAFTGLGAPHWDPHARGTIVGMTRGTRREHVARATLESIAYQTRDVVAAMAADSGLAVESLRVDGGAVENDLLCQLQADALDATIHRPVLEETTALGAAFAAGLAVDYWTDLEELRETWRVDREFAPDDASVADMDDRYDRWKAAVERAKGWAE
jgi:glycerol kinase